MIAVLVAASCGAPQKREYIIPDDFCRLEIPQTEYSPLFGPGENVKVEYLDRWGERGVGSQGCYYFVDGNRTVSVIGSWVEKNDPVGPDTPSEVIKGHNTRDIPKRYPGPYGVRTWSGGAVGAVDCPRATGDSNASFNRFLVDVYANDTSLDEHSERAHKVFGKLAQSVMSDVVEKLSCGENG
ncbi:hypothetical protein [Streptomyces sp. AA1529]|uniref:hypothetical protein n=1 Tax=Streptomyces sp. AA1529 TaxID=1203257 RepID=UPI003D71671A